MSAAIGDRIPARILPDRREVTTIPDTRQVDRLIARLRAGGGAFGTRLAFVISPERPATFGMGRMYQIRAEEVDLHVDFFTSMEEGRAWLTPRKMYSRGAFKMRDGSPRHLSTAETSRRSPRRAVGRWVGRAPCNHGTFAALVWSM